MRASAPSSVLRPLTPDFAPELGTCYLKKITNVNLVHSPGPPAQCVYTRSHGPTRSRYRSGHGRVHSSVQHCTRPYPGVFLPAVRSNISVKLLPNFVHAQCTKRRVLVLIAFILRTILYRLCVHSCIPSSRKF